MTESTGFTRRHFLTVATAVTGGVGVVATAVPFVASFQPSARAQALGAPVEQDISKIEVGAMLKVEWRGRPIYILHRSKEQLDMLDNHDQELRDPTSQDSIQPSYAMNEYRSIRPAMLIVEGVCTHLGCAPQYRPEVGEPDLGAQWPGGFYCPCHGSRFDLSGRVFVDVPAPTNLTIPPYRYINDSTVLIGSDTGNS